MPTGALGYDVLNKNFFTLVIMLISIDYILLNAKNLKI